MFKKSLFQKMRALRDFSFLGRTSAAAASSTTQTSPQSSFQRSHYHSNIHRGLSNHQSTLRSLHFNFSAPPTLSKRHRRRNYFSTTLPRTTTITTAAAAAKSPSKRAPAVQRVTREVEEYWRQVLESVDKPTAKRLINYVDPALPLGLPDLSNSPSVSFSSKNDANPIESIESTGTPSIRTATGRPAKPPAFSFILQTKLEHPTKVVVCRVGEFYETVGIDAILLVQHAGLNPMGKGNTPRAGCPRTNLRRTVSDLVEGAGLSVVVCEEAPEGYQYGAKKQPKQRYVAAVVTPAAPHFLHGMIDEDTDLILESAPPLLGIAPRVGGYDVIEVDAELLTVRVSEGLTEDAVYSRLHEGGLAPPLYLHTPATALSSTGTPVTDAIPEAEWERRVASVFRTQIGAVQRYNDGDPVQGMLERVKRQLNLRGDTLFRELPAASPTTRPRPLYMSTASNLGLHKIRGVPSLIEYALPAAASLTARRWLRKLLLLPPPPHVGVAIHAACAALQNAKGPVPSFPVMTPANVILKLRSKEANDTFFRELGELCRAVLGACTDPALQQLSAAVLVPTEAETGVRLNREVLARACSEALAAIHDVVDHDAVFGNFQSSSERSGVDDDWFFTFFETSKEDMSPDAYDWKAALTQLFQKNEDFRGKIRPEKLEKALSAVAAAREKVKVVAYRMLTIPEKSRSWIPPPTIFFDTSNNAVWLRFPRGFKIEKIPAAKFIQPKDRNGKDEKGVYSTTQLEAALDDYRRACSDAHDAVRTELRKLSEQLQPSAAQLVAAATFAVIASTLDAHVREAARRGWALPHLLYGGDNEGHQTDVSDDDSISSSSSSSFSTSTSTAPSPEEKAAQEYVVEGMWPYWLGGAGGIDSKAIKNSFRMNGMFLLTGPNMAGKSTLLRSTCAVALLGACGLAVPAAPTTKIPYFDAFMLRNFSADSPLEGRSSFAVEMTEMRYVLQDATACSLVLVDELGKGTEARAGAALAGAMLEALDETKCRGVFATHLHSLLDMELKLPGTERMKMEVEYLDYSGGSSSSSSGGSLSDSMVVNDDDNNEGESGGESQQEQQLPNQHPSKKKENQKWRAQRKPTWRMIPGESVESLALEVASECRLPGDVVDRAAHLYAEIMTLENGNTSGGGGDEMMMMMIDDESPSFSSTSPVSAAAASPAPPPMHGLPGPSSSLRSAAALLKTTAISILTSLSPSTNQSDSSSFSAPSSSPLINSIEAQFVPAGQVPPARTIGASCVYIAHRSDGKFYVGSTDSLQDRIKAHRQRGGTTRVRDPLAEFAYIVVPQGAAGASAAKTVEAAVIRAMLAERFQLLSVEDARKRNAPINRMIVDRNSRYNDV